MYNCWGICIYATDSELQIGKLYDIERDSSSTFWIINENGKEAAYNKKWFVSDRDPEFILIMTAASIRNNLFTEKS